MTPAQKKIAKYIKEIEGLEKKNSEVLRFIELPYRDNETVSDVQINILKKVMIF